MEDGDVEEVSLLDDVAVGERLKVEEMSITDYVAIEDVLEAGRCRRRRCAGS